MPFPTSCSPQAWASATPVQLLRTLLRFEPRTAAGVSSTRCSPEEYLPLRVQGLRLGNERVDLEVTEEATRVDGLASDVEVLAQPALPSG